MYDRLGMKDHFKYTKEFSRVKDINGHYCSTAINTVDEYVKKTNIINHEPWGTSGADQSKDTNKIKKRNPAASEENIFSGHSACPQSVRWHP